MQLAALCRGLAQRDGRQATGSKAVLLYSNAPSSSCVWTGAAVSLAPCLAGWLLS